MFVFLLSIQKLLINLNQLFSKFHSISCNLNVTFSFFFPSFSVWNINTLFPAWHNPYSFATFNTKFINLSLCFSIKTINTKELTNKGGNFVAYDTSTDINLLNNSGGGRTSQNSLKRFIFSNVSSNFATFCQAYEQINIIIESNTTSCGG